MNIKSYKQDVENIDIGDCVSKIPFPVDKIDAFDENILVFTRIVIYYDFKILALESDDTYLCYFQWQNKSTHNKQKKIGTLLYSLMNNEISLVDFIMQDQQFSLNRYIWWCLDQSVPEFFNQILFIVFTHFDQDFIFYSGLFSNIIDNYNDYNSSKKNFFVQIICYCILNFEFSQNDQQIMYHFLLEEGLLESFNNNSLRFKIDLLLALEKCYCIFGKYDFMHNKIELIDLSYESQLFEENCPNFLEYLIELTDEDGS